MRTLISTLSIVLTMIFASADMQAQRRDAGDGRNDNRNSRPDNSSQNVRTTPPADTRSSSRHDNNRAAEVRNDNRHDRDNNYRGGDNNYRGHDNRVVRVREREIRRYPRQKTVIVTHRPDRFQPEIHRDHRIIRHRGYDYSYYNGHYYRPQNGTYVIVAPPRGIRVNMIPSNFLTIMVGRRPYYYYDGVYYKQDPTVNDYEVVDPPMGAIVPELPQEDVRAVVINGKTYFEYDNILYKAVVTNEGVQYKVMGTIADIE